MEIINFPNYDRLECTGRHVYLIKTHTAGSCYDIAIIGKSGPKPIFSRCKKYLAAGDAIAVFHHDLVSVYVGTKHIFGVQTKHFAASQYTDFAFGGHTAYFLINAHPCCWLKKVTRGCSLYAFLYTNDENFKHIHYYRGLYVAGQSSVYKVCRRLGFHQDPIKEIITWSKLHLEWVGGHSPFVESYFKDDCYFGDDCYVDLRNGMVFSIPNYNRDKPPVYVNNEWIQPNIQPPYNVSHGLVWMYGWGFDQVTKRESPCPKLWIGQYPLISTSSDNPLDYRWNPDYCMTERMNLLLQLLQPLRETAEILQVIHMSLV